MARTVHEHLGACPPWLLALVCVVLAESLDCCLCRSGGACPPAGHGHAGQSGCFCCAYVGGGTGDDCCCCNGGDDCDCDCDCSEIFAACLGALIDYCVTDDEV